MFEWLHDLFGADVVQMPLERLLARVTLGLFCGFAVAAVYVVTLGRQRDNYRSMPTTCVLLSVLISIVTIVIGTNMARAFGLGGVLAIVRFRTVVENASDSAFVIFAVTLGMAAGAGYWELTLLALPVVGFAAHLMTILDPKIKTSEYAEITVKLAMGLTPESTIIPTFQKYLSKWDTLATGTAKQGTHIELRYAVRIKDSAMIYSLITDLNKLDGVQSVEWKPE
jgi:hypothetical protein